MKKSNMKRFLALILWVVYLCTLMHVSAADCEPPFNGDWVVTADCDYPAGGYKVYWDITVGEYVITVPTGVSFGIDLTTNKITFTTGRIDFQWTATMNDSVTARNYVDVAYTSGTSTSCPSWYAVANTAGTAFQWWTWQAVATSGTIRCGKT